MNAPVIRQTMITCALYLLMSCSPTPEIKSDEIYAADVENACAEDHNDSEFLITDPKAKSIVSISDTLYAGEPLRIKFKTPHAREIAILAPDEKYFSLNSDSTIIPFCDDFTLRKELTLLTETAKSIPYEYGLTERELIFNKTGVYKVLLSDNLETCGMAYEAESIVFINKKRTTKKP